MIVQVEHRGMTPIDAYQYVRARRPRVLLATAQWRVSVWLGSYFYVVTNLTWRLVTELFQVC